MRRLAVAAGLDAAAVVAFAAAGRRNHDEQPGIAGLVDTAWPFAVALGLGWAVARAWRHPTDVTTGLVVWPVTVAGGMVLRRATGDGTALSFVVVASLVLGGALVGWRVVGRAISR